MAWSQLSCSREHSGSAKVLHATLSARTEKGFLYPHWDFSLRSGVSPPSLSPSKPVLKATGSSGPCRSSTRHGFKHCISIDLIFTATLPDDLSSVAKMRHWSRGRLSHLRDVVDVAVRGRVETRTHAVWLRAPWTAALCTQLLREPGLQVCHLETTLSPGSLFWLPIWPCVLSNCFCCFTLSTQRLGFCVLFPQSCLLHMLGA